MPETLQQSKSGLQITTMTSPAQIEKAAAFKALHERPGAFVIPNPWDTGTARLLASLGFEALATTSAGLAFSLGRPDGRRRVTRDETLENARAIVAATALPVAADLENGFGDAPQQAAETIRMAGAVGLVGGSIEDASGDPDLPIYDFNLAVERVAAAAEAAHRLPFPFLLSARSENFLHGRLDLDDTIKRLRAFEEAGADVLFAPGLPDLDAIRAVCDAVTRPVNVLIAANVPKPFTVSELAAAGAKRISLGSALSRAAISAFMGSAREIVSSGTFESLRSAIPYAQINQMME